MRYLSCSGAAVVRAVGAVVEGELAHAAEDEGHGPVLQLALLTTLAIT